MIALLDRYVSFQVLYTGKTKVKRYAFEKRNTFYDRIKRKNRVTLLVKRNDSMYSLWKVHAFASV
jgi:hypothetical protein